MAEFDPIPPSDAAEAAYREALLGDDAGRERRRARLMAALSRSDVVAAVPVAPAELAWRWQPYVLGLLGTGLLVAAALVLKGRPAAPQQQADPRLAAGPPASTAVVVAQAEPSVEPAPPAVTRPSRAAARAAPAKPRAAQPESVVVADAASPRSFKESEASAAAAVEAAAPVAAAPPPPAASPRPPAESVAASASSQVEVLARAEPLSNSLAQRANRLAASEADSAKAVAATNAVLLAAVGRADPAAVRVALQAGASAQLRDSHGRTVLMLAARSGARDVVDLLLAAGARKADRDPDGLTAADHAVAGDHGELIDRLR